MVFDDGFGQSRVTKKVTIRSPNGWLKKPPMTSGFKLLIVHNLYFLSNGLHFTQFGPRDALV